MSKEASGKPHTYLPGRVGYAFVGGRLITTEHGDGLPHAGISAGVITDPMQFVRAHAEVGAWCDLDGDGRVRTYSQLEARIGEAPHWDAGLGVKFEGDGSKQAVESRVGISFYR